MLRLLQKYSFRCFLFDDTVSMSNTVDVTCVKSGGEGSSDSSSVGVSNVRSILMSKSSAAPVVIGLFPFIFLGMTPVTFFPPDFFFRGRQIVAASLRQAVLPLPTVALCKGVLGGILSARGTFTTVSYSPGEANVSSV